MRRSILAFALAMFAVPAALNAQSAQSAQPSLRDQLMPAGSAVLVTTPAPVATAAENAVEEKTAETANQPVMAARGSGVGFMIAGLALFVAGLVIDDNDAGTVLVIAGAGIGAYGLYLYFR